MASRPIAFRPRRTTSSLVIFSGMSASPFGLERAILPLKFTPLDPVVRGRAAVRGQLPTPGGRVSPLNGIGGPGGSLSGWGDRDGRPVDEEDAGARVRH